jgi:hypothetical protein
LKGCVLVIAPPFCAVVTACVGDDRFFTPRTCMYAIIVTLLFSYGVCRVSYGPPWETVAFAFLTVNSDRSLPIARGSIFNKSGSVLYLKTETPFGILGLICLAYYWFDWNKIIIVTK